MVEIGILVVALWCFCSPCRDPQVEVPYLAIQFARVRGLMLKFSLRAGAVFTRQVDADAPPSLRCWLDFPEMPACTVPVLRLRKHPFFYGISILARIFYEMYCVS